MTIRLHTHEGLTISNFTYSIFSTYHVLNSQQIYITVKIINFEQINNQIK